MKDNDALFAGEILGLKPRPKGMLSALKGCEKPKGIEIYIEDREK